MRESSTPGIEMIAAERLRQIEKEGYDADHDDTEHEGGELAWAAMYYAMPAPLVVELDDSGIIAAVTVDPYAFFEKTNWARYHDKRDVKIRIQQLTVAGALIAAEIDRQLRLEQEGGGA